MKYFQKGDILLTDFDGVILDSQKHFEEAMKGEKDSDKWTEFLNGINWKEFIRECDFIPGAIETFTELQKLKILRGIITRIHSFEEGKEKAILLREVGIQVPIYYTLLNQKKSQVYIPKRKIILLDDHEDNYEEWEQNGGKSILFNEYEKSTEKRNVKSLYELLK